MSLYVTALVWAVPNLPFTTTNKKNLGVCFQCCYCSAIKLLSNTPGVPQGTICKQNSCKTNCKPSVTQSLFPVQIWKSTSANWNVLTVTPARSPEQERGRQGCARSWGGMTPDMEKPRAGSTCWAGRCWQCRSPAAPRAGRCRTPGASAGHGTGSTRQRARCISDWPLQMSLPALSACLWWAPGWKEVSTAGLGWASATESAQPSADRSETTEHKEHTHTGSKYRDRQAWNNE